MAKNDRLVRLLNMVLVIEAYPGKFYPFRKSSRRMRGTIIFAVKA